MRALYLHGFASGVLSGKAQFFQARVAEEGIQLEIPDLAAGDFENLTVSGQLRVVEQLVGSDTVFSSAPAWAAISPRSMPRFMRTRRSWCCWRPRSASRCGGRNNSVLRRAAEWRDSGYMDVFHYAENRHGSGRLGADGGRAALARGTVVQSAGH